jgi:RNA polymerase sigma-70 factor, ECF subfamily
VSNPRRPSTGRQLCEHELHHISVIEQYFTAYHTRLTRHARCFVADNDTAEDCVQNVFVRLLERAANAQLPRLEGQYFFRGVRNECLHEIQRRRRWRTADLSTCECGGCDANAVATDAQPNDLDCVPTIDLTVLPPRCLAVCQCRARGLSYTETARELGISKKTVDAQIQRAKALLRGEKTRKEVVRCMMDSDCGLP